MIGAFTFKGKSSSDFNLICKSVKRPLLPALQTNFVKIPGKAGVFDPGGSVYDLMNLTMKIQYLGINFYELRERARSIASWLGGTTWGDLKIEGDGAVHYKAIVEAEIDLESIFEFGSADIPFVCQPFAISDVGSGITLGTTDDSNLKPGGLLRSMGASSIKSLTFINEGTVPISGLSQLGSIFTIEMNTFGVFTLNDQEVIIENTDDVKDVKNIIIDVPNNHISINTSTLSTVKSLDIPLVCLPGENHISSSIPLKVNFVPMYY